MKEVKKRHVSLSCVLLELVCPPQHISTNDAEDHER